MQDKALYNCRLLLIEDPTIEAQSQHEVMDGVGRNLSQGHDAVGPALVSVVCIALKIPWYGGYRTEQTMRCGTVLYVAVVLLCAIPLRWGIAVILLLECKDNRQSTVVWPLRAAPKRSPYCQPPPPPRQGVWAATTTVTVVRRESRDLRCCMLTP